MPYRADIDGLRAVAVILVVVFHAKFGVFSGGFIGVDVFFVISGFLIASIIANDVSKGRFSVAQFYARRARRILPALFLVLIVSTVAALYLLVLPQDLETYARSARATLLFYSNFFFSRSGDYFKPAIETQPLLHTWSLGVEEQFYLVAPLLLAPLMVSPRRRVWFAFGAVFVIFLLISQYGVHRAGARAFYWPQSRVFELMIGVAIASPLLRSLSASERTIASLAGITMIMLAATTYTAKTVFPGVTALLPAVGAALLIWSGKSGETIVGRALSLPSMVFAGKISYPLYLWHWPIFVFAGLLPTPLTSPWERVGLIVLAVACATATYYLLEVPIRRKVSIDAARRPWVLGGAMVATVVWFLPLQALIWSGGWGQRFGPEVARFTQENPANLRTPGLCRRGDKLWDGLASDCVIGDETAAVPTFILWGDSHARVLAPLISAIAKERGIKGYFVSRGGCEPLELSAESAANAPIRCRDATKQAVRYLENPNISRIIIAGRWANYHPPPVDGNDHAALALSRAQFHDSLSKTVDRIVTRNRRVTIIGPIPEPRINVPLTMTQALIRGRADEIWISKSDFKQRNAAVLQILAGVEKQAGVSLLYPDSVLCDAARCLASEHGNALYVDDNHLSPRGVAKLGGLVRTIFGAPPAERLHISLEH